MEVVIEAISFGLWGKVAFILASQSTVLPPTPTPDSEGRQVEGICQVIKPGAKKDTKQVPRISFFWSQEDQHNYCHNYCHNEKQERTLPG